MSSNNMYRVGDYVYFESSSTAPFQIRRIDELNKTPTGAVEAKVTCYYRRRDISSTLIQQAEKYYFHETDLDFQESSSNGNDSSNVVSLPPSLSDVQRHQVKHRELFLSRLVENLPATHIRGKCSVTLLNEVEPLTSYIDREDFFYYRLSYDPTTKRLQEDRGSMRIGSDYQSEIVPLLPDGIEDARFSEILEELVWDPMSAPAAVDLNLFLILTKAAGLFARASDPASLSSSQLISAACMASRDTCLQRAHDLLHQSSYDLGGAFALLAANVCVESMVTPRDELETWTLEEADLFEEALEKYSKVFPDILTDFLPTKSPKSIVELYYFWKTTDRYVQHRRTKLAALDHKLKQVYIPNYSKPSAGVLYTSTDTNDRGCECCHTQISPQWYAWGPPNLACRLCVGCWGYWKKYGGLKNPDKKGVRPAPKQRVKDRLESSKNHHPPLSQPISRTNSGVSRILVVHKSAPAHHPISEALLANSVCYCTQPGCVKEFRSPDNLIKHLTQVHGVSRVVSPPVLAVVPEVSSWSGCGAIYRSGTQFVGIPVAMRIARVACPGILRPAKLARKPFMPAGASVATGLSSEEILERVKTFAKEYIPRLPDPASLLRRSRPRRCLGDILSDLLTRRSCVSRRKQPAGSRKRRNPPDVNGAGPRHQPTINGLARGQSEASNSSEDSSATEPSSPEKRPRLNRAEDEADTVTSSTSPTPNGSSACILKHPVALTPSANVK